MNPSFHIPALCLAVILSLQSLGAQTANQILANPDKYKGADVNLDVALLRPIRWDSPNKDFAIFHALTYDRRENAPGGEILLVAPESSRDQLVRRYGVTLDGRMRSASTTRLRGTLQSTRGDDGGLFYIDLTGGAAAELIKDHALKISPPGSAPSRPKRY